MYVYLQNFASHDRVVTMQYTYTTLNYHKEIKVPQVYEQLWPSRCEYMFSITF